MMRLIKGGGGGAGGQKVRLPTYPRKEFEGAFETVGWGLGGGRMGGKRREELVEIGNKAVWTLTTAKPGNGIHQVRLEGWSEATASAIF